MLFSAGGMKFVINNNNNGRGKSKRHEKSMEIMQTNLICIVLFSSTFSSYIYLLFIHCMMEQLVDENCLTLRCCQLPYIIVMLHGWWLWMKAFREDMNKLSAFQLAHMCKQSDEINSHSISSLINITNYTNFTNLFKPELTLIYFKRNFLSYIYLFVYFSSLFLLL